MNKEEQTQFLTEFWNMKSAYKPREEIRNKIKMADLIAILGDYPYKVSKKNMNVYFTEFFNKITQMSTEKLADWYSFVETSPPKSEEEVKGINEDN